MNKYLKGCLIFLVIGIAIIAGIMGWYYYHKATNARQAETDGIKYSKLCDSTKIITEMPAIMLVGFDTLEIKNVRFYIIRQGRQIKDTVITPKLNLPYEYISTQIPFTVFLKTDTILIQTGGKVKRFYQLSDFHHYAYLHYGMMGYLGSYDCRLDEKDFLVNGKRSDGQLFKKSGLTRSILPIQLKD